MKIITILFFMIFSIFISQELYAQQNSLNIKQDNTASEAQKTVVSIIQRQTVSNCWILSKVKVPIVRVIKLTEGGIINQIWSKISSYFTDPDPYKAEIAWLEYPSLSGGIRFDQKRIEQKIETQNDGTNKISLIIHFPEPEICSTGYEKGYKQLWPGEKLPSEYMHEITKSFPLDALKQEAKKLYEQKLISNFKQRVIEEIYKISFKAKIYIEVRFDAPNSTKDLSEN